MHQKRREGSDQLFRERSNQPKEDINKQQGPFNKPHYTFRRTMGNCVGVQSSVAEPTLSQTKVANADKHKNDTHNTTTTGSSSSSFRYTKNTCALEYWDPVRLLGEGSISTIHLVRRRPARVDIPYKERADIMARAKKAAAAAAAAAAASESLIEINSNEVNDNNDNVQYYALKSIIKDHIGNDRVLQEMRDEIYTMSHLSHPNIVRVLEAYERKRHVYLIMELCTGGDLVQLSRDEGTTEPHAKAIVRHILQAVAYIHENGVVHRDRKFV